MNQVFRLLNINKVKSYDLQQVQDYLEKVEGVKRQQQVFSIYNSNIII